MNVVCQFQKDCVLQPGRILTQPPEIFSLSPRGTSGERDGERRGAFNKRGLLSPTVSSCGEEKENISSGQVVVVSRCASSAQDWRASGHPGCAFETENNANGVAAHSPTLRQADSVKVQEQRHCAAGFARFRVEHMGTPETQAELVDLCRMLTQQMSQVGRCRKVVEMVSSTIASGSRVDFPNFSSWILPSFADEGQGFGEIATRRTLS